MPRKSYAVDVAFEVEGDYAEYTDIPYEALIEGMQRRLNSLKANPVPEAFDCFDEYTIKE